MPPKIAEKPAADTKDTKDAKAVSTHLRELDAAISSITKSYGEGSIMRLGDARALVKIEVIPTGALALDLALGVGGIPRGRVIEIFGPESSGKTTLMLHVIANAQKTGGLAAFIDAEREVQRERAGGNHFNFDQRPGVAETHDAALAVALGDGGDGGIQFARMRGGGLGFLGFSGGLLGSFRWHKLADFRCWFYGRRQ